MWMTIPAPSVYRKVFAMCRYRTRSILRLYSSIFWWEPNMKPARAFSLALVLGSMTLPAQNSGHPNTQSAVARVVPGSSNCLVDMRAQWQFGRKWLQNVPSSNAQHPRSGRGIKLTLTNPTSTEIVGARITAYGVDSKPQLSPAGASEASPNINKSFDLKLSVDPKSETSTDLQLAGFASVTFISVDSIRYAGGSTWVRSPLRTCHVVPDAAMLISSL
jgi:hypothetical protein